MANVFRNKGCVVAIMGVGSWGSQRSPVGLVVEIIRGSATGRRSQVRSLFASNLPGLLNHPLQLLHAIRTTIQFRQASDQNRKRA